MVRTEIYVEKLHARLIKFIFAKLLSTVKLVGYNTARQVNSCFFHGLSGQDYVK